MSITGSVKHSGPESPSPFLRYPGGKTRILDFLRHHVPDASGIRGRYVEPFVGGGALFFSLCPPQSLLSDINADLIDLYSGIKAAPREVWHRYAEFGSTKTAYDEVRGSLPPPTIIDRAARILFLNRTCFKGMWRQNKQGEFNVGYGGQDRRWVITLDLLRHASRALRTATLRCCDFEIVLDECGADDFIFADPPYRPGARDPANDHYVGRKFSYDDHRRLASALFRAHSRGASWAMTTSAHPEIVALFGDSLVTPIPRGTGRRPGTTVSEPGEVLITSYRVQGGGTR